MPEELFEAMLLVRGSGAINMWDRKWVAASLRGFGYDQCADYILDDKNSYADTIKRFTEWLIANGEE